jgi:hypothetical protein
MSHSWVTHMAFKRRNSSRYRMLVTNTTLGKRERVLFHLAKYLLSTADQYHSTTCRPHFLPCASTNMPRTRFMTLTSVQAWVSSQRCADNAADGLRSSGRRTKYYHPRMSCGYPKYQISWFSSFQELVFQRAMWAQSGSLTKYPKHKSDGID